MKKKFLVRRIIAGIILLIIVIAIVVVICVVNSNHKSKFVEKPMKLNFEDRVATLANYKYENYLVAGWLQVQGTNIDYPILTGAVSAISPTSLNFGWRSPTYISGENREVLIGHNIVNVSSTPIRDMTNLNNFEGLMAFTYDDFAKNNLYISYTKGNDTELYKIYAIGFYDYYSDGAESFDSKKEVKEYIDKVRKNSIYDYDIDVNSDDYLITVKTCTRYFGSNEKQQIYIDARRVRDNEEITTYQVKTNDNYKILSKGITNDNG